MTKGPFPLPRVTWEDRGAGSQGSGAGRPTLLHASRGMRRVYRGRADPDSRSVSQNGQFMSTDITPSRPILSANQLREMGDFDDALTVLADTFGPDIEIEEAADAIGDGFSITKDKDQFVGQHLLIVNFAFNEGDYEKDDGSGEKGEFATVWVMSARGKHKFADGSTGVAKQLRDYFDRTGRTYLRATNGLRRSEYTTPDGKPAKTYYIDTTR